MAQARNILGFGGYQARIKEDTKEMHGVLERERESENLPYCAAATLGFLGSGKEGKKILSIYTRERKDWKKRERTVQVCHGCCYTGGRERRPGRKGVYVCIGASNSLCNNLGWSLSWGSLQVQDSNPYLSSRFSPFSPLPTRTISLILRTYFDALHVHACIYVRTLKHI